MVEKKQIVDNLMLNYNGPQSVEGFYEEVENWISENGLQKEIKRKTERVTSQGRKIEWEIEAWKNPVRAIKQMVRIRALFDNVKEINVKIKGKTMKINEAKVFVNIDGWLETSLTSRWTQRPLYTFFRTLYDKYIWVIGQSLTEANEGPVQSMCYDLHKRIKAFFELYKMKVA